MHKNIDKILSRIFLSLLVLVILFLIGEAITRHLKDNIKSPFRKYNDPKTRVIKPYVMFGGQPHAVINAESQEKLNALGYRGELPQSNKGEAEYRIFIVGGSTVMLTTVPGTLQDLFERNGFSNVNVFNFGSISSESGQSLARMLFEIADLQPDLIIMYEGGNDIMDRYFADPRPGYPYNFMVYEQNPLLENNFDDYPLLPLIANGSAIFRPNARKSIRKNILKMDQLKEDVGFGSREWKEEIVESYINNIQKGNMLAQAMGAKFISFFQPLYCTKKVLNKAEQEYLDQEAKDYCLDMVQRTRTALAKLSDRHDGLYLDVSNVFDQEEEYVFLDYIHLTVEYDKKIAQRIFKEVKPILLNIN